MAEAKTYYGTDGELVLNVAEGAPGADTLSTYFPDDSPVGRLKNISVYVTMDIKAFHELGSQRPTELRAGNIHIGGTVERAYINGALLKLMLGTYADQPEAPAANVPSFNMTVTLDNFQQEGEAGNSVMKVLDVYFDTWQFNLPEDDFVLEKLSFKARRITVEDKE